MSTEPALDLQEWLWQVLKEDASVSALVSDRVYDFVPKDPTFPYIRIPGMQTLPETEGHACFDVFTIFGDIHAWSRVPGHVEAKKIAGAIRNAIRAARDADKTASPTAYRNLDDYCLEQIRERSSRWLEEEGNTVTHLVFTYEAVLSKANA